MKFLWVVLASLPGIFALLSPSAQQDKKVSYTKDVLPIFRAKCLNCHSGKSPSGGLSFESTDLIRKGGNSGALWIQGKPDESLLLSRILGKDGLPQMPMGFAPLSEKEVSAIRNWISEGSHFEASYAKHWAYVPPTLPKFPKVKNLKWVQNPIDQFVLKKIEDAKLQPSPKADKSTLIRRVYLDLIGLPPSKKEVDEFLADNSPGSYERVVDRLLVNPHFGEKQARPWLDLAHFADTNGYEADRSRTIWPYRDWVIHALNSNMPFDQFSIEQIAGDLLPKPKTSQLVATGFYRNAMTNEEGGVDADEAMYNVINDRVATTSTVWLGSTLQCARCHNHKYDPFSQKDYFQMYAFFANNKFTKQGDATVGQMKYYEPDMAVPTANQEAELKEISKLRSQLQLELEPNVQQKSEFWKRWSANKGDLPRWVSDWNGDLKTSPPATVKVNSMVAEISGENPDQVTYSWKQAISPLKEFTGLIIEVQPMPNLVNKGPGRSSSGNFILSSIAILIDGKKVVPEYALADFVQGGYKVEDCFDNNPETGWAVSPEYGKPHQLICWFRTPNAVNPGTKVEVQLEFGSKQWVKHSVGRFWLSFTDHPFPALQILLPKITNLGMAGKELEIGRLLNTYDPGLYDKQNQLKSLIEKESSIRAAIPRSLVLVENGSDVVPHAPIRIRGEFLSKGEEVKAGTPSALPKLGALMPQNRLGLAKWLTNPSNPLTARVQVNRMWEQLFGRGIVETVEDFGTQGSAPANQELLDYLAVKFVKSGWNLKELLKLIVTSATYQQISSASAKLVEVDPSNVLLARGPRFRLEAEVIRDVVLSVGGLLDQKIGGPSVFPPQPEFIWDSPYSDERWMESKGKEKYRRGLYTFWKRTATYPSFSVFDATTREECTPRRIRTNTPLQALAMMNDPVIWEASQALARRVFREKNFDPLKGCNEMFVLATCRPPSEPESRRLNQLYKSSYSKQSTEKDFRALTVVANAILNLDEVITKS